MNGEELIEKGIVIKVTEGKVEVALIESDNCEECSAKIFCNPKDGDAKVLGVIDKYGVKEGDEVVINVEGKSILGATFLLYFFPLVVLMVVILFSLILFENSRYPEVYSFGLGVAAMAVYYFIVNIIIKRIDLKSRMPKITRVIRDN